MDNQPSFDRSLLLPIGVAIFSLVGICIILVAGRLSSPGAAVEQVPTATSFEYAFIGTEPAISTLTQDLSVEESPTRDLIILESPTFAFPTDILDTPTQQAIVFTSTGSPPSLITLPPIANTGTPTRTPTSAFAAPFSAGTYDDVDSRFVYSGDWDRQSGVSGTTGGTLHVSGTLGNSIRFLFIGNELRVFFQAGPSLGTIRLTLDSTSYVMNESAATTQSYEWVLAASTTGTHTVTITHDSGGAVNFDAIIVPEPPVTPTRTATTNP